MAGRSRWLVVAVAVLTTVLLWRHWSPSPYSHSSSSSSFDSSKSSSSNSWQDGLLEPDYDSHPVSDPDPDFVWRKMQHNFPLDSIRPLPQEPQSSLPPVQAKFGSEYAADRGVRLSRQAAIRDAFSRAWDSYKLFAWLRDEVTPVSGQKKTTLGGWGAMLIDSLDTLWIMGMQREFEIAVNAIDKEISFETTSADEVNVFETTIRFLGGLLSAYELSGDGRLLSKARDAGDMLYKAFDTPNHMPMVRWNLRAAAQGHKQNASTHTFVAELGSLSMEFTRLSLLTSDSKYYDAVQHVSEVLAGAQMTTKLPGMWPVMIDARRENFDLGVDFTFGGLADSTYEYLIKMVAVLGDTNNIYSEMYTKSIDAALEHILFRPMTPDGDDILFFGKVRATKTSGKVTLRMDNSASHLTCFTGGMLALGGRLLKNEEHVTIGSKLTKGCIWAYDSMSTKVMPETFHLQSCPSLSPCPWEEARWHEGIISESSSSDVMRTIADERLPRGFTKISDRRYLLRPEAIESIFIMYRVTGDSYWREKAWEMWTAIDKLTSSKLAHSAVSDVNPEEGKEAAKMDSMESFWTAETLKYFYLIFSEPDVVSLDDWVFNTEAHPFRRRKFSS
jgi:mannosyl-oligosaccharide alpha-1,2-mannosidase